MYMSFRVSSAGSWFHAHDLDYIYYLADAFIQSDLVDLTKQEQCGIKGLAQGPTS